MVGHGRLLTGICKFCFYRGLFVHALQEGIETESMAFVDLRKAHDDCAMTWCWRFVCSCSFACHPLRAYHALLFAANVSSHRAHGPDETFF